MNSTGSGAIGAQRKSRKVKGKRISNLGSRHTNEFTWHNFVLIQYLKVTDSHGHEIFPDYVLLLILVPIWILIFVQF